MVQNVAIQRTASVIQAIVSGGQPKVINAMLSPLPLGKVGAYLFVRNDSAEDWWDDTQFAQLVAHVARAHGMPIEYVGHQVVGRTRETFKPFSDVEVFVSWEPFGPDDELLNDPAASCGVGGMPMENSPGLVWGWLPGHVLEVNENDVAIKLMRRAWLPQLNKYSSVISVPINEPLLRLARRQHVAIAGGVANA